MSEGHAQTGLGSSFRRLWGHEGYGVTKAMGSRRLWGHEGYGVTKAMGSGRVSSQLETRPDPARRGGSFGQLSPSRRLPFGLTGPQTFLVDFAHQFAVAEHADHFAPILASLVGLLGRNDLLQGLDSFGKRFQGQVSHCAVSPRYSNSPWHFTVLGLLLGICLSAFPCPQFLPPVGPSSFLSSRRLGAIHLSWRLGAIHLFWVSESGQRRPLTRKWLAPSPSESGWPHLVLQKVGGPIWSPGPGKRTSVGAGSVHFCVNHVVPSLNGWSSHALVPGVDSLDASAIKPSNTTPAHGGVLAQSTGNRWDNAACALPSQKSNS